MSLKISRSPKHRLWMVQLFQHEELQDLLIIQFLETLDLRREHQHGFAVRAHHTSIEILLAFHPKLPSRTRSGKRRLSYKSELVTTSITHGSKPTPFGYFVSIRIIFNRKVFSHTMPTAFLAPFCKHQLVFRDWSVLTPPHRLLGHQRRNIRLVITNAARCTCAGITSTARCTCALRCT